MAKGSSAAVADAPIDAQTAPALNKPGLDKDKYLRFYEQMVHIREFEELCDKATRQGTHGIGGYVHLYSGEEAIAVGIIGALDRSQGDCFIGHYRDHAYALASGSEPGPVMAEICGKATGCSKGKGGSMHICDAERGFFGGYGIVGGNVPIALGLAYALKYQGKRGVCVCFFGDGSMNQGAFHETLNMCQLYKVPVLFVLENNGYAMGTSVERSHANPDLVDRVSSFAMKRESIDGQEIVNLHTRVSEIVAEMRETQEPFFLECKTYRYHGHGAADNEPTQSTYRTKDEVQQWRSSRDPIHLLEGQLVEAGILTESERARYHDEAIQAAIDALKFADESPDPAPEALLEDVYA